MTFLVYLLLILSALGMIYGVIKYRQGYPWAQSLTVVCAVITLVLAFYTLLPDRSQQRMAQKHREQREEYKEIISEKAGRFLAENYENANILVIARSQEESTLKSGFKEGIGSGASLDVVVPDFGGQSGAFSEDSSMVMEMEMMDMMEPETMDQVIEQNLDDHDLIVTFIGLPYGVERMDLWRNRNHPPLAVIGDNSDYMQMGSLAEKIDNGQIAVMTVRQPEDDWELKQIPEDLDEAFDQHYLLITPDNVKRIANEHPEIFQGAF